MILLILFDSIWFDSSCIHDSFNWMLNSSASAVKQNRVVHTCPLRLDPETIKWLVWKIITPLRFQHIPNYTEPNTPFSAMFEFWKILCSPCLFHRISDRVQIAALTHLQHGGLLQVRPWWLRCLNESCTIQNSVEAKYFCAVAVNCRPSYLNFLLRLRQSCPDEPLKHRNIGKIPQKSSHISQFFELWNGMMDGWMNANNDVLISGYYL